jgi:undecaprenyl-diphosphatase
MMYVLQAIFLGIVEGLTEFLPISSTGHLIIAENVIGYHDTAKIFTVVVQIGAIAAIAWHYRTDLIARVKDLLAGQAAAKRFWINLVIATIPAGLVGLALDKTMEKYAIPSTVAIALILGGIVIFWAEARFAHSKRDKQLKLDDITPKQALGVGLAQIVSLIPGVSRSGATIIGGLGVGLNRITAVTFSFYLSLPILGLASAYKLFKARHAIGTVPGGAAALLFGTIAAFASASFVIKWLLKYVANHDLKQFAYYRIYFGVFLLLLVILGLLSNSI